MEGASRLYLLCDLMSCSPLSRSLPLNSLFLLIRTTLYLGKLGGLVIRIIQIYFLVKKSERSWVPEPSKQTYVYIFITQHTSTSLSSSTHARELATVFCPTPQTTDRWLQRGWWSFAVVISLDISKQHRRHMALKIVYHWADFKTQLS